MLGYFHKRLKSHVEVSLRVICFSLMMGVITAHGQYTFVFLNKRTDKKELSKEAIDELMKGHLANIQRLADEGKLIAAGPFDGGGGIFVFNSTSTTQVEEWLATDPGVQAKRWNIEILPYQPLIRSICKVGKPYEMVSYYFVRFWPEIKKHSVHDATKLILKHEEFWKDFDTESMITFGSFKDDNGDIIVAKSEIDDSKFSDDPSVKAGLMRFEKKVLWIAKGSFCEN